MSLLLFLPLFGSLTSLLFSFIVGPGSGFITVICLLLSFLLSFLSFIEVGFGGTILSLHSYPWMVSGDFSLHWGLLYDPLTVTMLVVVTSVSSMVHIYSLEYMAHDPHRPRFMSYLSLFTFFMLVLVTGDNLLQLFLGWEGIGLSSYLLINFWSTRLQANKAAIKAMLVNRIGDMGLVLGLLLIYSEFSTLNYGALFPIASFYEDTSVAYFGYIIPTLDLLVFFLLVGTAGKSAQLGLHTWLPDAMEGPTPVSALIHAATLVTAGVFLISRCSPMVEFSSIISSVITVLGAMTALFAATTGLLQNDRKRVIAYSTCSQLGYMVFACGLSSYSVGIFHLYNHAFFKALLFLSAGSVIHAMMDEQDMRRLGGLVSLLPLSYSMIFIGSLALMGFPYLTGFYSKDVILESSLASFTSVGHFAYVLGTMAAFCTAFYSLRLLYLTFLSNPNSQKVVISSAHDAPIFMALPLIILSFGALFIGYLSRDLMIGLGTPFWGSSLFTRHLPMMDGEFLPHIFKVLPVLLSISGALSSLLLYGYFPHILYSMKVSLPSLYTFLNRKWMFDKVFTSVTQSFMNLGYRGTYLLIDRGVLEHTGPFGISSLLVRLTSPSSFRDGSVSLLIQRTFEGLLLITLVLLLL